MTPFAQLGVLMEKSAYQGQAPPAGYEYQTNARSGLRDPYAPYRPTQQGPGWGVIQNGWGDAAVSAIPFVGSAYMGNKAVQDFRQGNWGSGIGNSIWAGLSLIPGVGVAKAGLGVARAGVRSMGAWNAAKSVGKGALSTGPMGWKGMTGAAGAGMAAPMMDPSQAQPQPANAYGTPTTPMGDLHRTMTSAVVNNGQPPA